MLSASDGRSLACDCDLAFALAMYHSQKRQGHDNRSRSLTLPELLSFSLTHLLVMDHSGDSLTLRALPV